MNKEKSLNSIIIEGKKTTFECFPDKGYAQVINANRGFPKIDYNLDLINLIKDYAVTYDRGWHKATPIGGIREQLQKIVYKFYYPNENTNGYEIDHLNSIKEDNRLSNLCKLPKTVHASKLDSIDNFYIPYTMNLGMNHSTGKLLLILANWGIDYSNGKLSKFYEANFIIYLEYSDRLDIVHDLDLFKKDPKHKIHKESKDYPLEGKMILLTGHNKATRMRIVRLIEPAFESMAENFVGNVYIRNGVSQGRISNDWIMDFDIFDKNKVELEKMGLEEHPKLK